MRLDERHDVAVAVGGGEIDGVAGGRAVRSHAGGAARECRRRVFARPRRDRSPSAARRRTPSKAALERGGRYGVESASHAARSANAMRLASTSRWRYAGGVVAERLESKPSRMLSISSATKPWVFGGISRPRSRGSWSNRVDPVGAVRSESAAGRRPPRFAASRRRSPRRSRRGRRRRVRRARQLEPCGELRVGEDFARSRSAPPGRNVAAAADRATASSLTPSTGPR